jgi:hypothetical protein
MAVQLLVYEAENLFSLTPSSLILAELVVWTKIVLQDVCPNIATMSLINAIIGLREEQITLIS